MLAEELFWKLYRASTEPEVDQVFSRYPELSHPRHWKPYGGNRSNFGVVENQQASPIPALVEKLINSVDAILMRRCHEEGIDPRAADAPHSIEEGVRRFFPQASSWDLPTFRREQAERIQVIADGPRMDTSLVIYDEGEGQHPEDFEETFLSLLRGNKNEIHFVQGKYNMGGAGAIAFCGKERYQLVASKRWTGDGEFGFTLLRRHPLTDEERRNQKNTWYEYLVLDGKIPSFAVEELDLGLHNRMFRTGTVIKLYSYDLPSGARSVISRDLNQSLNEYLFAPALPILTVDQPERYPNDRNLQRELYGLKRRLEEDGSKYVAEHFSEDIQDEEMGRVKVTCYVFRPRIEGKNAKESKQTIQREFFKNNMAVLFSVNGQVHGHYTSEFITRSLKFQLLKDYLLIHVDCTDVRLEFRNELFMASRDRLKGGEESRKLRQKLADVLSSGRLKEVYKERKASITVESKDSEELLRNFTRNLPLQQDLVRLLGQTLKLEDRRNGGAPSQKKSKPSRSDTDEPAFEPKRFPSFFKIERKTNGGLPIVKVPLGSERTIRFSTDVEDQYFDRVTDPGELRIALLDISPNQTSGGTQPGLPDRVEEVLNVVKTSSNKGTIRVAVNPTKAVQVGDAIKLRAELSGAGKDFEEIFFVKITDPERKTKEEKGREEPDTNVGLPKLVLVYKDEERGEGGITWDKLDQAGIEMDHSIVVQPRVENDVLDAIYINMDSRVLLDHRSKLSKEETITVAERRYISAVYFHTLFLYMITRNRKYSLRREEQEHREEEVDVTEYLKDLFQSYYAEFLLNFEVQELITALEE